MAKKPEFPLTVRFEQATVRIQKRGDGRFALAWREGGTWRRTTKKGQATALEWAAAKARALAGGRATEWVDKRAREELDALRKAAGPEEGAVWRFLEDARAAREILADTGADLVTAARWFARSGPRTPEAVLVSKAISRFLAEYDHGSKATRRTFGTELGSFAKTSGTLLVQDLDEKRLREWVDRPTSNGKPEPRTLRNRITTWATFMNRCRDWGLLPEGSKTAAERLRRPTIPSAGREILSIAQGRALLAAVREEAPRLEIFLLIAGWLGLRPSEAVLIRRRHFHFETGHLEVPADVALKVSQERWVPMDPRVASRIREILGGSRPGDRVCLARSREFLSRLAREKGILEKWPPDVLRHSFCSYRLAILANIAQVAQEAGNSPRMIQDHYRRPLRPHDGEAWWSLLDQRN